MRDRTDQAEIDFDTKGALFNVIAEHPVRSLFDGCDDVKELEPEIIKKPGRWVKRGSMEVYLEDEK